MAQGEVEVEGEQIGSLEVDALGEARNERVRACGRIHLVPADELGDDAEQPSAENAPQDVAGHPVAVHDGHGHQADDRQGHLRRGEGAQVDQRRGVVHHDPGIGQAHQGNEQADAGGDAHLQVLGHIIHEGLAELAEGEQNEDDALHEHGRQRDGPGILDALLGHGHADRVGEVGIQAHAAGQGDGVVRVEGHEQGAEGRRDGCGREHRPRLHARCGQDGGVDGQDVHHGQEGDGAGHRFRFHRGAVLPQLEGALEELLHGLSFSRKNTTALL